MRIKAGFRIGFSCPQETPILLALRTHPSRRHDLLSEDGLVFDPGLPSHSYLDSFGNLCTRIVAPAGDTLIHTEFLVRDSGQPDPVVPDARQHAIEELPDDVLVYLLGSRYVDTDHLGDIAGALFTDVAPGWPRVQAICDFVHNHIAFDYAAADDRRTAYGGYQDRTGVCRDFAHLAVALCRCMNIPARYCTGYLGDIGVPADPAPMDFSAWFEAWLGGRWYAFDARHNVPRIGRILVATGRDATDVALSTSFGAARLTTFEVLTEEVAEPAAPVTSLDSHPARRRRLMPPRRLPAGTRAAPR
ncbi:transglutaminase family protein [Pelagibius sp. 7325]|uniref:transglutaminase-like domain-containing protein n=1 Tax=Pelagibius sp. 7325 TaxID=3131994 RepID=UPI0030ED9B6E